MGTAGAFTLASHKLAVRLYGVAELTQQQAETFQFLIVLMLTNA